MVAKSHVDDALDIIHRSKRRGLLRRLLLSLGGAMLGAGLQGFPTELSSGRQELAALWFVVALVGLALITLNLNSAI